jgi:hypothetical protein
MRIPRLGFVLIALLLSFAETGHANTPVPGAYTDGPGLEFFKMLRFGQFDYAPTTFDETVEKSSVIAKGHLLDVIPGRSIGRTTAPSSPSMTTVFLKILPSKLLKGNREDYYLVEVPASQRMVSELREELYSGELLFLLLPAGNFFTNPRISVSSEAQAEWISGKPLYMLTMHSTLFTISGIGNLASPLDVYYAFHDLYTELLSLEELESHILSIQGGQPFRDDQAEGGSRQWYENPNSEPQGFVQERYESGQLRSEISYQNGEMEGPARYWYESGALQAEASFIDGEEEGLARFWFENGQMFLESTFQDGQRIECQAWTEDGRPVECPGQ